MHQPLPLKFINSLGYVDYSGFFADPLVPDLASQSNSDHSQKAIESHCPLSDLELSVLHTHWTKTFALKRYGILDVNIHIYIRV